MPNNHVLQCHIYTFLKCLQVQWLHHLTGRKIWFSIHINEERETVTEHPALQGPSGHRGDLVATCIWAVSNRCALQYCSCTWHKAAEASQSHFCNMQWAAEELCKEEGAYRLSVTRHSELQAACWHYVMVHKQGSLNGTFWIIMSLANRKTGTDIWWI